MERRLSDELEKEKEPEPEQPHKRCTPDYGSPAAYQHDPRPDRKADCVRQGAKAPYQQDNFFQAACQEKIGRKVMDMIQIAADIAVIAVDLLVIAMIVKGWKR